MAQARRKAVRRSRRKPKKNPLKIYLYVGSGNEPFPPTRVSYRGYIEDILPLLEEYREMFEKAGAKRLSLTRFRSISELRKELEKLDWGDEFFKVDTYYNPKTDEWYKLVLTTNAYPSYPGEKYIDLTEEVGSLFGRYPVVRLTRPFNSGR